MLQMFDGTYFEAASLNNLMFRCTIHLEVDITYWKNVPGEGVVIEPTIYKLICPNDCSRRGVCKEGKVQI